MSNWSWSFSNFILGWGFRSKCIKSPLKPCTKSLTGKVVNVLGISLVLRLCISVIWAVASGGCETSAVVRRVGLCPALGSTAVCDGGGINSWVVVVEIVVVVVVLVVVDVDVVVIDVSVPLFSSGIVRFVEVGMACVGIRCVEGLDLIFVVIKGEIGLAVAAIAVTSAVVGGVSAVRCGCDAVASSRGTGTEDENTSGVVVPAAVRLGSLVTFDCGIRLVGFWVVFSDVEFVSDASTAEDTGGVGVDVGAERARAVSIYRQISNSAPNATAKMFLVSSLCNLLKPGMKM